MPGQPRQHQPPRWSSRYYHASNRQYKENVKASADHSVDLDEYYTYDDLHRLQSQKFGDLTGSPLAIDTSADHDTNMDRVGRLYESLVRGQDPPADLVPISALAPA